MAAAAVLAGTGGPGGTQRLAGSTQVLTAHEDRDGLGRIARCQGIGIEAGHDGAQLLDDTREQGDRHHGLLRAHHPAAGNRQRRQPAQQGGTTKQAPIRARDAHSAGLATDQNVRSYVSRGVRGGEQSQVRVAGGPVFSVR